MFFAPPHFVKSGINKIGMSVFLSVSILTFSGCGSSSPSTTPNTLQTSDRVIQNENDSAYTSDYKVENFTNADWLYQNYFGEYGLPNEFQSMIDIELKRLANGMALSQAYGDDMEEQMSKFDRTMKLFMKTSGAKEQMMNLKQELSREVSSAESFPPVVDENLSQERREVISDDKNVSAVILEQSDKEKEELARLIEEERKLVEQYNLPYKLEGENMKILNPEDVTHEMRKWTEQVWDDVADVFEGARDVVVEVAYGIGSIVTYTYEYLNSCLAGRSKHEDIGNWNWWNGDIIYAKTLNPAAGWGISNSSKFRGAAHIFTGGHVALVLGSKTLQDEQRNPSLTQKEKYKILESHPSAKDGLNKQVAWGSWQIWTNDKDRSYNKINAYYYKRWGQHDARREALRTFAVDKLNRGEYTIFTSQTSTDKYYCSKLVWQAYKSQGVSLPTGGWIIRPDALMNTSSIGKFEHSNESTCR